MANRTSPCRVCGKQFIPCGKSSAEIGAFNYKEVACSPECGKEYLRRVLESRKPAPVVEVEETKIELLPVGHTVMPAAEKTNKIKKVSEDIKQ